MDTWIKIVHFAATHPWLPMTLTAVFSILLILIPVLKADRRKDDKKISTYGVIKRIAVLCLAMSAMVLGTFQLPDYSSSLIYDHGKEGTGVITGSEQTDNMYNNQYVMRYFVLLKDEQGITVETQFKSADFNVYPAENIVSYPRVGEGFAMRYLASDPEIFVILSNKKSEYTRRLGCEKAFEEVSEAKIKFESDSLNNDYRNEYAQSLEHLLQAECYKGAALEEQFIEIDKATLKKIRTPIVGSH